MRCVKDVVEESSNGRIRNDDDNDESVGKRDRYTIIMM